MATPAAQLSRRLDASGDHEDAEEHEHLGEVDRHPDGHEQHGVPVTDELVHEQEPGAEEDDGDGHADEGRDPTVESAGQAQDEAGHPARDERGDHGAAKGRAERVRTRLGALLRHRWPA